MVFQDTTILPPSTQFYQSSIKVPNRKTLARNRSSLGSHCRTSGGQPALAANPNLRQTPAGPLLGSGGPLQVQPATDQNSVPSGYPIERRHLAKQSRHDSTRYLFTEAFRHLSFLSCGDQVPFARSEQFKSVGET